MPALLECIPNSSSGSGGDGKKSGKRNSGSNQSQSERASAKARSTAGSIDKTKETGKADTKGELVVHLGTAGDDDMGAGPVRARRVRITKMKAPTEKQVHVATVKLVLSLAQLMRDVKGSLYTTYMLKADSPEVVSGREQLRSYGAACLAKGKGHGMGPPAIYLFAGVMKGMCSRGDSVGMVTAKALKEISEKWTERSAKERCELVPHCRRVSKVYDQELAKLEYMLGGPDAAALKTIMSRAFGEIGAKKMMGAAPPGGLEDILQKYLDGK